MAEEDGAIATDEDRQDRISACRRRQRRCEAQPREQGHDRIKGPVVANFAMRWMRVEKGTGRGIHDDKRASSPGLRLLKSVEPTAICAQAMTPKQFALKSVPRLFDGDPY